MTDGFQGSSFDPGVTSFGHDTPYLDALLSERLASMGSTGATAGLSFDISSGLDFNEAKSLGDSGIPSFARPNAAAEILNGVVDQQMPEVEVSDVRAYQNKLKQLGYLPRDYQVTGQWDSQSSSAAYELNQHASSAFRQGNSNPTAISAKNAFALLNATMPSKVFQGLVGMVQGIGKSFAGTGKHVGAFVADLAHGHFGDAIHEFKWEDALNALTVASMFVGVGDLVEAGRGLFAAGDFGSELGSLLAKPAATDLAANAAEQGPSLASKLVSGIVRRFSSGTADNYLDWVAQNGFNAQAQRPLLKAAANIYGGLSKMSFFPQAESILIPHSVMGQKVSKAPTLPGVVDWSTLVLHPETGLTPFKDFGHALAPLSAGILDFTRLAGIREPVDSVSRIAMATQAFAANNAAEKVLESEKELTGAYRLRAFEHAMANEKNAALTTVDDARQIDPEYAQKAIEWANKNPHAAAAYIKTLQTSAQAREGLGLTGFNPEESYRNAENIGGELTKSLRESQPKLREARDNLIAAQSRVDELSKAAQGGDYDAFVQLQQAKQELSKAESAVDLHDFGTIAKDGAVNGKLDAAPRVLAQRADNPRTLQNVRQLLSDWNDAKDDSGREQVRQALRAIGLGDVSDAEIPEHLKVLQDIAPYDLTDALPAGYREELQSHGYKAVLGGDDVFLRSDVNPLAVTLPKYSNLAYYAANIGLSPKAIDPTAVGKLVNATTAQSWDQVLNAFDPEKFPLGSGQTILDDWHGVQGARTKALAKMGETEGPVQRMISRAKLNIQNSSISGLRNFLADRWVDDPKDAASLARQLQKAALQANFHPGLVNSPSHALGILDQASAALRIHGLPGLVEGLRAMSVSDIAKANLASAAAGLGAAYATKEAGGTGKEQLGAGLAGAVLGQKVGNKIPYAKLAPLAKFGDSPWGFLPDNLMRAALATRFTLSPMFEARLLAKGQEIRGMKYNLPLSFAPLKTMTNDGTLDTYTRIWEQATGKGAKEIDDATRAMTNSGIFGYNVRNHTILDYGRMYDRLTTAEKLKLAKVEVTEAARPFEVASIPESDYYHGTSQAFAKDSIQPDRYSTGSRERNLFGPGMYVTDSPEVAASYTNKGRGTSPTVYGVKWNGEGKPNLLDLDKPLPTQAFKRFESELSNLPGAPEDVQALKSKTGAEVYKELKNSLSESGYTRIEADEVLTDLHDNLLQDGYDGFTHRGGVRTGSAEHNASVFFDPGNLDVHHVTQVSNVPATTRSLTDDEKQALAHARAIDWLKAHGPQINSFGPRSPLEKSINAVFFPFSFEKKFATVLHDYFTAAPVRTLLAHHALSLADQLDKAPPGQQSKWQQLITNHAPILKEVNKLNALAYGISPGEFGGVFAPLAASLGVAKEAIAGAFMPHVVTDDTSKKFANLLPQILPAWTAVANLKNELVQTSKGIQGETSDAQINDYFALKQAIDNKYADYGAQYGTNGTLQGFESSKLVPFEVKRQYENDTTALKLRFPDGASFEATMANKSALQQNDLTQLLGQVQLLPVQQAIGRIVQVEAMNKIAQAPHSSAEDKIRDQQILISEVRNQALVELKKYGLAFNDLWERYGFDRTYGPIVAPPDQLVAA